MKHRELVQVQDICLGYLFSIIVYNNFNKECILQKNPVSTLYI